MKPKGGSVYLYDTNSVTVNDWRADGYRWLNRGKLLTPNNNPVIRKDYFAIQINKKYDNRFRRQSYQMCQNNRYVLVHYIGDSSLYVPTPHGNSHNQREYMMCAPSVIKNAETALETQTAAKLYKMVAPGIGTGIHHGILNPRDRKMLENIRSKVLNMNRFSPDALSNIVELYYHIPGFIRKVEIVPDFNCVLISDEMVSLLSNLLANKIQVTFAYDTTFNIGDYYVSTLVTRHIHFENDPVIPVGFMLHERKLFSTHQLFFKICSELIPLINKSKSVFIVDREKTLTKAINNVLPGATIVKCCNHIKADVKSFLYKCKATPTDRVVYVNDVGRLLNAHDLCEYQQIFSDVSSKWSNAFIQYYKKNIEEDLCNHSSRWVLERLALYSEDSGITNNISESFNTVLKSLCRPKLPADLMVVTAYQLTLSSVSEIRRGYANVGNYILRPEYSDLKLNKCDIENHNMVTDLKTFLDIVKGRISANLNKRNKEDMSFTSKKQSTPDLSNYEHSYCAPVTDDMRKCAPQTVLADVAVLEKRVIYVNSANCYVVTGHQGKKYAVQLDPEVCQCPTKRHCYHIMAAQKYNQTYKAIPRKQLNLTLLRKRARTTCDKYSGKKNQIDGH